MDADEGGRIPTPDSSPDHVFIVRLWLERASDARHTALWRGRVTYVNTKHETYVGGVEAALDVVRATLVAVPEGKSVED
jgi:hypothetical protein